MKMEQENQLLERTLMSMKKEVYQEGHRIEVSTLYSIDIHTHKFSSVSFGWRSGFERRSGSPERRGLSP